MDGWIKLHRRLVSSKLWSSESFSRGQAWVDLLMLANHKPGFIRVRGNRIEVDRGQVGWSEVKLAERWKWSRGKVRRFLNELSSKSEQKIVQQKNFLSNLITIVNYEKYQGDGTADGQQTVQQTDSRRYTNKKDKNEKKEKKKDIYSLKADEVLDYLNQKTGKSFRRTEDIIARLKDGGTVEECILIIDNQSQDGYFMNNPKYMNPTTLFRKSHWDKYLNNTPDSTNGKISDLTKKTLQNLDKVELL